MITFVHFTALPETSRISWHWKSLRWGQATGFCLLIFWFLSSVYISWQNAEESNKPHRGLSLLPQSFCWNLPVLRCAVGMCCNHHGYGREPDDRSGFRFRPTSEDSLQCAHCQPGCRWSLVLHHPAAHLRRLLSTPQVAQWSSVVQNLWPAPLPLQLCLHHYPLPGSSGQISPGRKESCVWPCFF